MLTQIVSTKRESAHVAACDRCRRLAAIVRNAEAPSAGQDEEVDLLASDLAAAQSNEQAVRKMATDPDMDLPTFDIPFNDMRRVPRGKQTLGGIEFTIGPGSLQLGSGLLPTAPERIEGIPVGRHVARMYVVHGTQFGGPGFSLAAGTAIGWYRVVYEDRSEQSIAIGAEEDVGAWYADDSQPLTRGAKVWEGKNLSAEWSNTTVRLYASGWTNPHPEKKVARIDYLAAGTQAAPFCLAITVEEPVSK